MSLHASLPSGAILTDLPLGDWAPAQKRRWVAMMLGPEVPVITCLARENRATPRRAMC